MSDRDRLLSGPERELFEKLFARFEASGITAILLRNYENFPNAMGHDLDVFFRRQDLDRAVGVFLEILAASGGEVLHVHKRDYVFAVWFRAAPGEPRTIHLDFYHGAFTWRSLSYVQEKELIATSRPFKNFKTPRPAYEALNLFLTSVLWGGFFKLRYRERIHFLLQAPEESAEFARVLQREFGPGARPPVDFANAQEPDRAAMRHYANEMRAAFKRRSFEQRPFATLVRLVRFWAVEWSTVVSPPGICVAILGPDGSGKSTVIQAVKERIEYYFGEVEERHWRPQFLGDVGVLLGQREKTSGPVTDPHGRAPHSMAVSCLRFFYYWLDYWLGYPTRVWKFRAKNHLVIFDRYAQDMWCDPKRYRLGLPRGLMKFFCRLTPQPELTFILLADAEIIHRRKGEVPLPVLRELLSNYAEAARQDRSVYPMDCNRPVDQIADQIAAKVIAHLQRKLEREARFR